MSWDVEIGDEFEPEFDDLHEDVQTEILALAKGLEQFGPQLGRPRVDTLKGSSHAKMKELRFDAADAFGGSPLPLTRSGRPFCWLPVTSPVAGKGSFTAN